MEYSKVKTYEPYSIGKNFSKFTSAWRNIRPEITNCHKCGKKFVNDESMDIAFCNTGGNKMICSKCGDELKSKEEK